MKYKYTVTPEMVYAYSGKGVPVAPDGYEISGFRPPKPGDWVLCNDGSVYERKENYYSCNPTLICRKVPKTRLIFETCSLAETTHVLGASGSLYNVTSSARSPGYKLVKREEL